jgi:hypothetical protein
VTEVKLSPTPAEVLGDLFGIEWDPDVMPFEEPHIFKSARTYVGMKDVSDADR